MIIVLRPGAPASVADELIERIEALGLRPLHLPGTERVVLGAIGDERRLQSLQLEGHPDVEQVRPILSPYKLVSREFHAHDTVVNIGPVPIGGDRFVVIAGPRTIESREQLEATARGAVQAGAAILRGCAFEVRTGPYGFKGLGETGLALLDEVKQSVGLPAVTEVVETSDISLVSQRAEGLLVSADHMRNVRLLQAVGRVDRPVILERDAGSSVEDLLLAAEHIMSEGNESIVLCEGGLRSFDDAQRNTLDLAAVAQLSQKTHLPVIVDISRGAGRRELVVPLARASVGAGADGLLIEAHEDPTSASGHPPCAVGTRELAELMRELAPFVAAAGRTLE